MSKVVLVYPPLEYAYTKYWHPHLGLAYFAGILDKEGHDVRIIDTVARKMDHKKFEEYFSKVDADIVGITATTSEIKSAAQIAEIVKRKNPKIVTIIGGPHTTALSKETLQEFRQFDIAVKGEGDNTIVELVEAIEKGKKLGKIKGIAYREGAEIKQTAERGIICNLDELPFPAWEKYGDLKPYTSFFGNVKGTELLVITGRGCPNQCVFCQRALGQGVRIRDVMKVVDEIERDIALGAKSIYFCDETFTLFKDRTMKICDEMIRRGINKKVYWHCETRVSSVDKEVLQKLKDAGCEYIMFGVESGNDYILKKIKKGITTEQVRNAFKWAHEVGMKTMMLLIFGLPYETRETVQDTVNLAMEVNPDYITIGILVPFPGTEIVEMAKKGEGGLKFLSDDWNDFTKQSGDSMELATLSAEELKKLQTKAYMRFYLRPSRILNLLQVVSIGGMIRVELEKVKAFLKRS